MAVSIGADETNDHASSEHECRPRLVYAGLGLKQQDPDPCELCLPCATVIRRCDADGLGSSRGAVSSWSYAVPVHTVSSVDLVYV